MISYTDTPIEEIQDSLLKQSDVRLLIKREDLNHPEISGNKWWKLKYNLEEAVKRGVKPLLTFGGSHSNHIYSVAAAGNILGMKSIGLIRGEEIFPLNSRLSFAREKGMTLCFISREEYRKKTEPAFLTMLKEKFGEFYLIPEGGSNELAIKGCREFGEKLVREIDFDCVCLPVGTGATMAGICKGIGQHQSVIGFSALKGGGFLEENVRKWLDPSGRTEVNWRIETRYHFGGYARTTAELSSFIDDQRLRHGLKLDHVYTAKALYGIYDLIRRKEIKKSSVVLMIHTGGLQGA